MRDDPFEVLLVRRSSQGSFASSLVFPGGAVDVEDRHAEWESSILDFRDFAPDERVLRIAAIRETWEETSILIGVAASRARPIIPSGLSFREFVEASRARLRLDDVVPFAHWVTPLLIPRRYDTRFYVARMPDGQVAVADGTETVEAQWMSPAEAALAARSGAAPIIFPTLMNLERLAETRDAASALAAARVRPAFTVQPTVEPQSDGTNVFAIPVEAGYSVTRFQQ